jgi:thiol-disulfide isomerase/thioredoxin
MGAKTSRPRWRSFSRNSRMKRIIAAIAAACVSAANAAEEKPASSASPASPAAAPASAVAAPVNPAAPPEALVEQIEELLNTDGASLENENAAATFWTKQLARADALIADFRSRFPTHPLRWRILMQEANAREIREELSLALPKGSRSAAEIYAEILGSPDADAEVKADASSARLIAMSEKVSTQKLSLPEWERELAKHLRSFPEHSDNVVLVEMRLTMVEELANARFIPLLEDLAKSKVPEIAELASSRLAAAKTMAELKAKPLELKFQAFDGSDVDLEKLRGKVVLIDFWATWCGPCMAEMPKVVKAYDDFKTKGFEIIGISLDEERADLARVLKAKNITWPQYFDGKGWENPYAKKYGIEAIPAMWLVNKAGMVIDTEAQEDLAAKIGKLLGE